MKNMKFKVKDIGEAGVDVDLAITPAWLAQECADLELRPEGDGLAFNGRIEPTADDYLLRGKLTGALLVPCGRCLETARLPLDVDVSVVYVERGSGSRGGHGRRPAGRARRPDLR